ncbi:hypothetical protein RND71_006702 [Anisodus tanguticus]|uniref:Uncharacterized protein n=1 Tax=Anisodus tanguticus TaxID=243964 RepID=A0AAE1SUH5_9SOLA|nr:hypothetical protein RND71_006702 [Anisodus tanguticus]
MNELSILYDTMSVYDVSNNSEKTKLYNQTNLHTAKDIGLDILDINMEVNPVFINEWFQSLNSTKYRKILRSCQPQRQYIPPKLILHIILFVLNTITVKGYQIHNPEDDIRQEDQKEVNRVEDELMRTPTSKESRIQMICPPAPKKPKSSVLTVTKRKRKMYFDIHDEVELLFPPALLTDLIKKIRTTTSSKERPAYSEEGLVHGNEWCYRSGQLLSERVIFLLLAVDLMFFGKRQNSRACRGSLCSVSGEEKGLLARFKALKR